MKEVGGIEKKNFTIWGGHNMGSLVLVDRHWFGQLDRLLYKVNN